MPVVLMAEVGELLHGEQFTPLVCDIQQCHNSEKLLPGLVGGDQGAA